MRSKVGKSKEADYGTVSNLESIRNASPVSDIPTWIEWCYRIMWALMRCVMPSRPSDSAGPGPCVPERRTTHHRPGLQGAFLHRAELVPLERYRTAGGVHYTTQAAAKRESRQPTCVSTQQTPHPPKTHPNRTQGTGVDGDGRRGCGWRAGHRH